MSHHWPAYLDTLPALLGKGQRVRLLVLGDMASIAEQMAADMAEVVRAARGEERGATIIIPVGPIDQFAVLARRVNQERLSLRETTLINMDEYLTDSDEWIAEDHPLSFRGFMNRAFYDRLDPALAPPPENRVFPDPRRPEAIGELIAVRGGVDACFGGIGINGHLAFNEPPEPGHDCSLEEFAASTTRTVKLACETRAINSVTVGGEMSVVPRRGVTVGMREILASRRLRFYCNRTWQSAVVRRALHGPLTPACPASLLRTHADASLTIANYVAAMPEIRLR
jgi:glucosamine-6-phosphate deaminase